MAHFDMLIQPEEGSGVFPVSLWAIRGVGAGQRLYCAPQGSWLEYSRRFEQTKLMDARTLGHADACIFRGEPVIQPIQCSPLDLARMGSVMAGQPSEASPVEMHSHRREEVFVSSKKAVGQASPSPAQFDFDSERPSRWPRPQSSQPMSYMATCRSSVSGTRSSVPPSKPGTTRNFCLPRLPRTSALPRRVASLPKPRRSLGVGIDNLSMDVVVELIDGLIEQGGCHQVATATSTF